MNHPSQPTYWQIEDMVVSLRKVLCEHSKWSLVWVPRRSNFLAHLLAKWPAHFNNIVFVNISCMPKRVVHCDNSTL